MRTDAEEEPLEIGRHRAEWVLVGPDDERMWLVHTVQSIQKQPKYSAAHSRLGSIP
jgi:hypothetical protein